MTLNMAIRTAFDWREPSSSAFASTRTDYLQKLARAGKTEAQVMKAKANRVNKFVYLGAYREPTNSERAPR